MFKHAFGASRSASNPVEALFAQRRGGSGGQDVTLDRALRLSAVWSCHRILAGIGSTLPLDQLRTTNGQTLPMQRAAFWDEPAQGQSLPDWLHRLWMSLLGSGNAYGIVTGAGPADLFRVPGAVELIDSGAARWKLNKASNRWELFIDGKQRNLWPVGDVWHLPLFTVPGRPDGLNPIAYAAATIGVGIAANEFGANWFSQGAHPSSLLQADQTLSKEQAQAIKDAFVNATTGREPAVLGSGLTYTPIQTIADESQFLETIGANKADIASMIGVPLEWIGAGGTGTTLTYANREQRWQDFMSIDFAPYLVRIEAGLSRLIDYRSQKMKFNVDAVLRSDLATRMQAYKVNAEIFNLTGVPVYSNDEIRLLEDRTPFTDSTMTRAPKPTGGTSQ